MSLVKIQRLSKSSGIAVDMDIERLVHAAKIVQLTAIDGTHLTKKDAARYLKVCVRTLNHYVKRNKIKTYPIGRRVLIKKSELDSTLRKNSN